MKADCITCKNSNCFFLKYCSLQWREFLSANKTTSVYQIKQNIFLEDTYVEGIYVVHKGNVLEAYSKKDNQLVHKHTVQKGDFFGYTGYSCSKHLFTAVAQENNTQICFFTKEQVYQTCLNNKEFAYQLMLFFLEALQKNEQQNTLNIKLAHG